MDTPLAMRTREFNAVARTGKRGCPSGGHASADALMIRNALISDAKNISSEAIKMSIPRALVLRAGERSGSPGPAKLGSIVFIIS